MANIHIPAVKQLGHTNSASPMQLNTNPVNIRLEKAYLQKRKDNVNNWREKLQCRLAQK